MQTAYYSVFYQLLRFTFWIKVKDTQEWTALLNLSLLLFLNLITLYDAVTQHSYSYGHIVPVPWFVGVFGLVVLFNHRVLLRNEAYRHSATIQKQSSKPVVPWLVAVYVLLSFLFAAYYSKQMHDMNVLFRH